MTIQRFETAYGLGKYYYDVQRGAVMSLQAGITRVRPLKWIQTQPWLPKRVNMVNDRGQKISFTESQVKSRLKAPERAAPVEVAVPDQDSDLSCLRPTYAYVLFSKKNQCSQFFFSGTTIKEALDKFARRGVTLDPADIQILNVETNKVQALKRKLITVWSLS